MPFLKHRILSVETVKFIQKHHLQNKVERLYAETYRYRVSNIIMKTETNLTAYYRFKRKKNMYL